TTAPRSSRGRSPNVSMPNSRSVKSFMISLFSWVSGVDGSAALDDLRRSAPGQPPPARVLVQQLTHARDHALAEQADAVLARISRQVQQVVLQVETRKMVGANGRSDLLSDRLRRSDIQGSGIDLGLVPLGSRRVEPPLLAHRGHDGLPVLPVHALRQRVGVGDEAEGVLTDRELFPPEP